MAVWTTCHDRGPEKSNFSCLKFKKSINSKLTTRSAFSIIYARLFFCSSGYFEFVAQRFWSFRSCLFSKISPRIKTLRYSNPKYYSTVLLPYPRRIQYPLRRPRSHFSPSQWYRDRCGRFSSRASRSVRFESASTEWLIDSIHWLNQINQSNHFIDLINHSNKIYRIDQIDLIDYL